MELLSQSQNVGSSGLDSSSEVSDTREAIHPKRSKRKQAKVPLAKKRRTTYDIRKQQKSDLVAEVAMLEKHLELLKHRVLLEQGEANTTIRHAEAANSVLHESIQGQRVAIAGAQGILVAHTVRTASFRRFNPKISNKNTIFVYLSSKTCRRCNFIRLGVDSLERRATQMAMKERKLREAKRLVSAWSQDLDTESTVSQENRFESPEGGFSVVRFDNAPLPATSVKAVYDAFMQLIQYAEIIVSELFGCITVREDTEFEAADISQLRLVSSTSHGATVESNSIVFSEFVDGPDECYGMIAVDFVDSDELYPYLPAERVRRDAITLVLIRAVPSRESRGQYAVDVPEASALRARRPEGRLGGIAGELHGMGRHDEEVHYAAFS